MQSRYLCLSILDQLTSFTLTSNYCYFTIDWLRNIYFKTLKSRNFVVIINTSSKNVQTFCNSFDTLYFVICSGDPQDDRSYNGAEDEYLTDKPPKHAERSTANEPTIPSQYSQVRVMYMYIIQRHFINTR